MGLWSRLLGRDETQPSGSSAWRPAAEATMQIGTTRDQVEAFLREGGGETAAGVSVTPKSSLSIAPVYRCTALITGAIATTPLDLKRRLDARLREDASDVPLWTILRRKPNAWQTPSQFRRLMQLHLLLRGNGYAMKVRSGTRLIGLIPLNPDRVRTEQIGDMTLLHLFTRKDGSELRIPQKDMFHLVGMSLDGITGLSVLSFARETIGAAIAMRKLSSGLAANGLNPGTVLSHPNKIGKDGQDTLRASLEAYRGADNAGKNLILEEGMTFERLGMSLADAEFIEGRGFEDKHIYMFFGVPPHMAGDTEKSTSFGTGIEAQRLGFQAFTLDDWMTIWEEAIARDCLDGEDPRLFARFNRNAMVRTDLKTRTAAYTAGRNGGWLSKNDIREMEDENPIETPDGDDYAAPLNSNAKPGGDPEESKEP